MGYFDIKLIFGRRRRCRSLLRLLHGLARYCSTSGIGPLPLGSYNKTNITLKLSLICVHKFSEEGTSYLCCCRVDWEEYKIMESTPPPPIFLKWAWGAQESQLRMSWLAFNNPSGLQRWPSGRILWWAPYVRRYIRMYVFMYVCPERSFWGKIREWR